MKGIDSLKKTRLWHIYYGTRGSAGSYIDCLQKATLQRGFDSIAYVSSRYRFKTPGIKKFFFPITEKTEKRNFFLKVLRYVELAGAYKWLAFKALFFRPVVNLSLIDDLGITYFFFRTLKFFGLKVFVTCHDVLSHHRGETTRRNRMYSLADKLIVHSSYARDELARLLGGQEEKIVRIPFPSSPFTEILSRNKLIEARESLTPLVGESGRYFLFIGIVRSSKGIDTLLDAWEQFKGPGDFKLVVAGKWTPATAPLKQKLSSMSDCILIDRYLNDEEFVHLIENAGFTILPYREYSHSAVLYACAWNRGAVIISDIDLFKDILPEYDLVFPRNDSGELAKILQRAASLKPSEIEEYRRRLSRAVEESNSLLQDGLGPALGDF